MLNLKKITTTVSLLSLGALSVALFSTGCDNGTSSGTGGAGGKSSTGGAGGTAAGGAAGGHGGSATGGAAGGHGGSATGGAGGSATGGAAGGHGGSATGGAAGGQGGTSTGGAGGSATGGAGGTAEGGSAGSAGGAGGEANIIYHVTLTGTMEVLPSGTPASSATGAATVTLNPSTGAVSVQGSFTGLSSAATSAHIHGPAAAGATADAIVVLTPTAATAGAISGTGTLTADQITAMKGGMTYINVHSANYSSGEIRGQIQ